MAFEEILLKAVTGYKGEAKAQFEQPSGVCATLVIRWIKYKFIGQDFWEGKEKPKFEKTKTDGPDCIWKMTTEGQKKIEAKHKFSSDYRTNVRDIGSPISRGEWVFGRLAGNFPSTEEKYSKENAKRLRAKLTGLGMAEGKSLPLEELPNELSRAYGGACYISLMKGMYYTAQDDLPGHAVGCYRERTENKTTYCFFDPNMGEVQFSRYGDFAKWFSNECYPAWKKHELYTKYDYFQSTDFVSSAELGNMEWNENKFTTRQLKPIASNSQEEIDIDALLNSLGK